MSLLVDPPPRREVRRLAFEPANRPTLAAADPAICLDTGSDKVLALSSDTGSDNLSTPSVRGADSGTLQRIANAATRARGNGNARRRELRFPTLRRVYARDRIDPESGEIIRRGASYYGDVWRYLQRWAYRILNDLAAEGYSSTSHHDLAALFRARLEQRAALWHPYDGRGPGLNGETIAEMADTAASAALRDWTPTYRQQQAERGRIGGSRSRRGPTWTAEDLDALADLDGLTVAEQAERTGKSPATIKRMRATRRSLTS